MIRRRLVVTGRVQNVSYMPGLPMSYTEGICSDRIMQTIAPPQTRRIDQVETRPNARPRANIVNMMMEIAR